MHASIHTCMQTYMINILVYTLCLCICYSEFSTSLHIKCTYDMCPACTWKIVYICMYIYIYYIHTCWYRHVQYMLLECIPTLRCFMHTPLLLGPVAPFGKAWARRFRSFQRQPGTPRIHQAMVVFPMC